MLKSIFCHPIPIPKRTEKKVTNPKTNILSRSKNKIKHSTSFPSSPGVLKKL